MRIRILLVIVFCLITLAPAQDTIEKKQLNDVKKQIEDINTKIKGLDSEKDSLLNQIYKVELQHDKAIIENRQIKLQLQQTEAEIEKKILEQKHLEEEVEKSKNNLRKILRVLYKIGGNTYLKLFIQVDNLDQLFHNYQRFNTLIKYKSEEIEKIKKNILLLNQVKNDLELARANLGKLQEQQEEKIRSIRNLKAEKLQLVQTINNDKDNFRQLLGELQSEEARLTELIYGTKVKRPLPPINVGRLKGKLRWPIGGNVVSTFGRQRSTKFNTFIINNGIKIVPSGSDEIQAVYHGIVVFADYYKGYGNLIILQHSPSLFTLYGHCEKLFNKEGDRVKEGQVIAIVGSSGSTYRKLLHFELRLDEDAQDPISWLRRKRKG